jgi:hypothetical protein
MFAFDPFRTSTLLEFIKLNVTPFRAQRGVLSPVDRKAERYPPCTLRLSFGACRRSDMP